MVSGHTLGIIAGAELQVNGQNRAPEEICVADAVAGFGPGAIWKRRTGTEG